MDISNAQAVVSDVAGIIISGVFLQGFQQLLQKRIYPKLVSHINDDCAISNFSKQLWKFTWHFSMMIFEIFILATSEFWPDALRGEDELWNYDSGVIPPLEIRILYIFQIGYFSFGILYLSLVEKPIDLRTMQVHHIVSLLLLWFSYSPNGTDIYLWKIGVILLLVHEIGDVFLSCSKCLHYANIVNIAGIVFALTIVLWVLTRWIWFLSVSISAFQQPNLLDRWQMIPCGILLSVLYILHILWGFAMMKVLYKSVFKGAKLEDSRDKQKHEEVAALEEAE